MKKMRMVYIGANPLEVPALGRTFSRGDVAEGPEDILEMLRARAPLDWSDKPKKESFRDDIVEKKEKP